MGENMTSVVPRYFDQLSSEGKIGRLTNDDRSILQECGVQFFHGTTEDIIASVQSGRLDSTDPAWGGHAMGGLYLTTNRVFAEFAAVSAARLRNQSGGAVVVEVQPIKPLLPDEDWPACLREQEPEDQEYRDFMGDLLQDYQGDVSTHLHDWKNSLSKHYASRYQQINEAHGITWLDSVRWSKSVRQQELLALEQIVQVESLSIAKGSQGKT